MKKVVRRYTAIVHGQPVEVSVYESATKQDMDRLWGQAEYSEAVTNDKQPATQPLHKLLQDDETIWGEYDEADE